MSHLEPDAIDRGFALLEDAIGRDARLGRELASSRAEFLASPPASEAAAGPGATDDLARRRHLEWFVLERESPALQALPIDLALEDSALALDRVLAQALHASHASVFEVLGAVAGEGIAVRDLVGLGEYRALEPEATGLLERGDLIVGRIFLLGAALHRLSRAAAFWRSAPLLAAVKRDLERARAGRRGSLRMSQIEIERMFFGSSAAMAHATRAEDALPLVRRLEIGDPVGEARRLLRATGLEEPEVESILGGLAESPLDASNVLPGTNDALAGVLEQLAFETAVDLERARVVLLAAWIALRSTPPAAPPPRARGSVERDRVARAVTEFDRKRSQGAPLEEAFQDLERELGLFDPGDSAEDEDTPAPDFPGVVAAVVEEFLWEQRREGAAAELAGMERLRGLGRFAADIGVLENLRATDLVAFVCRWLPEQGELGGAEGAREILAALTTFCRWAAEAHELPLHTELADVLVPLARSLPRVAEANRRCADREDRRTGPIFDCVAVLRDGSIQVRDAKGGDRKVGVDPPLQAWLQPGDQLRGRVSTGGVLEVVCCYPPEARAARHA